ncbi:DUF1499 domain-containing protein [Scytonema sp. PCC 10023]|uniref:DUF1499 domain-containing protein n=1 Tax=Scytonema sp. PCC 10023 TaxID=1680591 RepID=UPI0039C75C99
MIFAGKRPNHLGVRDGQLTPCPNTPNCVCSQSSDAVHKIEPLTYNSTPEQAFANLKRLIQSLPRTKIITESEDYLHVEFTLPIVGFVDDVEFYLERNANVIHVRSASRLGMSDLGVNRRRIETIRTKYSSA